MALWRWSRRWPRCCSGFDAAARVIVQVAWDVPAAPVQGGVQMTPAIHSLSLSGILIFGMGGFMLIWAWDTGKMSPTINIGACAMLVLGVVLFVTGMLDSTEAVPVQQMP